MRTFVMLLLALTVAVASAPASAPSAIATIRALRLENNRAIASHNIPLMRKSWSQNIRVIVSDGTAYSGSAALARSFASEEFKEVTFVAYNRTPQRITIGANGARAAESGDWIKVTRTARKMRSGTYLASWRKYGNTWKIVYEAYVTLNLMR